MYLQNSNELARKPYLPSSSERHDNNVKNIYFKDDKPALMDWKARARDHFLITSNFK